MQITTKLSLNHPLSSPASTDIIQEFILSRTSIGLYMFYVYRHIQKTTLYLPWFWLTYRMWPTSQTSTSTDNKMSMTCWHQFRIFLKKKTTLDKILKPSWIYLAPQTQAFWSWSDIRFFYWKIVKNITYIPSSWEPNPCAGGTMDKVINTDFCLDMAQSSQL